MNAVPAQPSGVLLIVMAVLSAAVLWDWAWWLTLGAMFGAVGARVAVAVIKVLREPPPDAEDGREDK